MKKRKVSNLLALAVLSYLGQGPMHPYELGRTLRQHGDERSIKFNHGSLYMVFGQLTKAGFITEQATNRKGQRPERTIYALTEAGRHELWDWLRELVEQPQYEYPQFVAALSLIGALPPDEVVQLLGDRLDRLTEQRTEIRTLIKNSVAQGVLELFLIEEQYRLALLEAEYNFVEQFIAQITHPETGCGPSSTATTVAARTSNDWDDRGMHLLLFYDYVDDVIERRAPFRQTHLALAKEAHEEGALLMAGALTDPVDGALFVFTTDDRSVVEDFVTKDPYVQEGLVTAWRIRPWNVVIG